MNPVCHVRKMLFCIVLTVFPRVVFSQPAVEFLGLADKPITSLGSAGPVVTVGTDGDGVYYQYSDDLPGSGWINLGLEGENVSVVWPHRVGPVGEVVITVGIIPESGDSIFVYCGGPGREFEPKSDGISKDVPGVYDLAGFEDIAICGEKYAAAGPVLYMQPWPDSVWTVAWSEDCIEGCSVVTVETSQEWEVGGFVVAGGNDGFGGPILTTSTDYGESWEYIEPTEGGPNSEVVSLDFGVQMTVPDDPYIDRIFVSQGGRVSRTVDGGLTWELSYEDGWNWFSEVVFDPFSQIVFIAGGDGLDTSSAVLFYSGDFGKSWTHIPLPMSGPIVGLDVAEDGHVYFAAPNSGVYRFPLGELETAVNPPHVPSDFFLSQPFPNPFNPSTIIEFSVPQAGLVTLTVYDLLGREVAMLLNHSMVAGRHKVRWNVSGVPSGIYFVRMRAGDFTQTKKLTVLR